jgi:hypothetical protein
MIIVDGLLRYGFLKARRASVEKGDEHLTSVDVDEYVVESGGGLQTLGRVTGRSDTLKGK